MQDCYEPHIAVQLPEKKIWKICDCLKYSCIGKRLLLITVIIMVRLLKRRKCG